MKTLGIILLVTIFVAFGSAIMQAAPLSETDKQFLARYEKIRSALATDDLGAARTAAGDLGDEGAQLAKSSSLKDARAAFGKLSDKAKQLAAGQSGFYVVHCPMLQKDWVQTNEKIANPYYGKEMAACGEIKK
jgi:Cu(I)/Ag(I) efflux system membrane fusion protein